MEIPEPDTKKAYQMIEDGYVDQIEFYKAGFRAGYLKANQESDSS